MKNDWVMFGAFGVLAYLMLKGATAKGATPTTSASAREPLPGRTVAWVEVTRGDRVVPDLFASWPGPRPDSMPREWGETPALYDTGNLQWIWRNDRGQSLYINDPTAIVLNREDLGP